jgi:serine/threonine protein kinase
VCGAEQIEEGKVGPRSDAYSLGGVLLEALTGYVPFPASDVHDALLAHLSLQTPTATEVAPGVPPDIDAMVAGA